MKITPTTSHPCPRVSLEVADLALITKIRGTRPDDDRQPTSRHGGSAGIDEEITMKPAKRIPPFSEIKQIPMPVEYRGHPERMRDFLDGFQTAYEMALMFQGDESPDDT